MERNLPEFIEEHTRLVQDLERDVALGYWNYAVSGDDSAENHYNAKKKALKAIYADRDAFARVRTYDEDPQTDDRALCRQLRLLHLRYASEQMPPDLIDRICDLESTVSRIVQTYRAEADGKRLSANDVGKVLAISDDSDERRRVWEAARAVGGAVAEPLVRLVGLRNRAARDLGYRDHYAMALKLQEIDEKTLFQTIDALVERTEADYRAAKASLDQELAERFGVEPAQLMPWHYADPFFQTAPARKRINLDRFYAEADLAALTKKFFAGIGLDIADILDRSDLLPRAGKDQHAFSIHIDRRTADVRVLSNNAPTEYWMSVMLHEFGHAVYDKNLGCTLPYLLREPTHQLATEGVAMFFGRLSKSPDFLVEVLGAAKPAVARVAKELDEQSRLQWLIMARWSAVMVHFERGLYEDPGRNLDRLWWDLVERFQHLRRPGGRRDGDWASKNHLATAPVYYHNYVLGELVATQLHAAIAKETGDAKIVGRPAAGEFLVRRLFVHGASEHWNDAMLAATGSYLSI